MEKMFSFKTSFCLFCLDAVKSKVTMKIFIVSTCLILLFILLSIS